MTRSTRPARRFTILAAVDQVVTAVGFRRCGPAPLWLIILGAPPQVVATCTPCDALDSQRPKLIGTTALAVGATGTPAEGMGYFGVQWS